MRAVMAPTVRRRPSVAESDEILTEDAHALGQVVQFIGENDWLPEASQIFAAGVSGPTRVNSWSSVGSPRW
jgi:hypothetical protein